MAAKKAPRRSPAGVLTAEATLRQRYPGPGRPDTRSRQGRGGHDLKFRVRVDPGGETPPAPDAVDRINVLLAEASEGWRLE